MNSSEDFIELYRREGYGLPQLDQKRVQCMAGSPQHTAAIRLIAEKQAEQARTKSRKEDGRNDEVIRIARGAHRLAKWSIIVAVLALIVSIVRIFLR